jgi:thiamine-phosphate pyrophosphorylase
VTELYVIIDPEHCAERDPLWVAERALEGGCALLQLRSKNQPDAARLTLAQALRRLTRAHGVPLWINDRLDIALLVEADGLHLGQTDLPVVEARRLGADLRIGLSTHSLEQARAAAALGADLLGFGPMFATRSKLHPDPQVSIEELRQVIGLTESPVVAIGGISRENAALVSAARPAYVAVISAVCDAPDPALAARELRRELG